jgi:hypothetical protein
LTKKAPTFIPGTRTQDLTGLAFGLLTVVEFAGRDEHGRARWRSRCRCGGEAVSEAYNLKSANTASCGCVRRQKITAASRKHGQKGTPLYQRWKGMIQRTTDPKAKKFDAYGGRGIKVCDRWRSFENFAADMGPTFREDLTLERLNVNGDYEPTNCTWATMTDQARNRRNNHVITWQGETMALAAWEEALGLPRRILSGRLRRGWSIERALRTGANPDAIAQLEERADAQTSPAPVLLALDRAAQLAHNRNL